MEYIEKIKRFPFMENEIIKDIPKDKNIEMLRKAIADIYERTIFKILVMVESEEEMEKLKSMWRIG